MIIDAQKRKYMYFTYIKFFKFLTELGTNSRNLVTNTFEPWNVN